MNPEGWLQVAELGVALVLSALMGLEREFRQKSAGLRTHTLVGVGSALFMIVSKYGFYDVLQPGSVVADPSRVAAQIVSGIGFLGAGLIFVRSDAVRGLTTAAGVWVTAAVGAAAGAGLPLLAAATTAMYLFVALGLAPLSRTLPRPSSPPAVVRIRYPDGRGMLRELLYVTTSRGFAIDKVRTEQTSRARILAVGFDGILAERPTVDVTLEVHGRTPLHELAAALSELDEVEVVIADHSDTPVLD